MAHNNTRLICPERARIAHYHRIVGGGYVVSDPAVYVHHLPPVRNDEAVEGTHIANVEFPRGAQNRARACHHRRVVRGTTIVADKCNSCRSHLGAVGDGQTVARTILADDKSCRIGPERPRIAHHHHVVRGGRAVSDIASAVGYLCPVGNEQAVGGSIVADNEISTVAQSRACSGHHHRVLRGVGGQAEHRVYCDQHFRAVGDDQAVGGSPIANVEISECGQSRVRSRRHHHVVRGRRIVADDRNGAGKCPSPIGDGQTVARTILADDKSCRIGPERPRIAHHHHVVRGGRAVSDIASAVGYLCPVGNDQAVGGSIEADMEISAAVQGRACSGHHHRVVRGVGGPAEQRACCNQHFRAVGDDQAVAESRPANDEAVIAPS